MPAVKANEARFFFKAATGNFSVLEFEGKESVSEPFYFRVRLKASDGSTDPEDLLKKRASLTLMTQDKKKRFISGVVMEAALEGRADVLDEAENYAVYSVDMVPMFRLLDFRRQSRIYQKMKVPDIVEKVLKEGGLGGGDFKMKLTGSYPTREYCVQYRETDMEFVSRLISEEGIFYFFEHEADREIMVFGDDITAHPDCTPTGEVEYHAKTGNLSSKEELETLHECSMRVGVYSGKVMVNDYNYEKPDMQLRFGSAASKFNDLEVYDHPAGHIEPKHGESLAKSKRDGAFHRSKTISGRGIFRCLTAGHKIKIAKHPEPKFNKLFVVLDVRHEGMSPQSIETAEAPLTYEARFSAVPAEVVVRPPQLLPKPRLSIQTAVVVGPAGEEIYTDEHGRVKVQFYWDRDGKNDENSSCWIRVSQLWAGEGWGAMCIPRIGQEVLVDFIEGDPDEPIIVGRVYNGRNLPPYPGEKTKTTIKSNSSKGGGGSNEIRFEDQKGEEELFTHAQKDQNEVVENNMSTTVKSNRTLSVGGNRTASIQEGDDKITVKKGNRNVDIEKGDNTLNVKLGNHNVNVDTGDSSFLVKSGKRIVRIKAGDSLEIEAGNRSVVVNGGENNIDSDTAINLRSPLILLEGEYNQISATGGIQIDAPYIHLTAGGSSIYMDSSGVIIVGSEIHLNP